MMPNENKTAEQHQESPLQVSVNDFKEKNGLKDFNPSDTLLATWDISRKRWHALLRGDKELLITEASQIAEYLGIPIIQLTH